MIRLDSTAAYLEVSLAASAAATNPQVYVTYVDKPNTTKEDNSDYRGAKNAATLNSLIGITACPAPPRNGTVRDIDHICVANKDSGTVQAIVGIRESGAYTQLVKKLLPVDTSLIYEHGAGWMTI